MLGAKDLLKALATGGAMRIREQPGDLCKAKDTSLGINYKLITESSYSNMLGTKLTIRIFGVMLRPCCLILNSISFSIARTWSKM